MLKSPVIKDSCGMVAALERKIGLRRLRMVGNRVMEEEEVGRY